MTDDLAAASLVVDIAGAVLLARALAFESAEEYAAECGRRSTWNAVGGLDAHADFVHARDAVEARVGTALLVCGFVGQAVANLVPDESTALAVIGYVGAGLLIGIGILALRPLRRVRERDVFVAQMLRCRDAKRRYDVYGAYLAGFTQRGQTKTDLDRWVSIVEARLGRHPWHDELSLEELRPT